MSEYGQLNPTSHSLRGGVPWTSHLPPKEVGLTAIVTGANGISGYHMVKVLAAAPGRWDKIYCLSRRPPPVYFFEGLGEGASRVKHVSADFLEEPTNVADTLKEHVSHV